METTTIRELNEVVEREAIFLQGLVAEVNKVIVGQERLIDRLLIGLLADGHILLEGVPGLAKTLAVKTLAQAVQSNFQRIQFTPDLLPADLIGTEIYNPRTNEFTPHLGPVFANFILADEINRAPAKVQSALLEAMQERQVTISDDTYRLEDPFLVLATQNPIEQEGTYPLPEAQVDRFMLKVVVGYPTRSEERLIMDRMTGMALPQVRPVIQPENLLRAREVVKQIYVDDKIKEYVLDLIFATRYPAQSGLNDMEYLISYGASPRATIYLIMAARAHAFLRGRGFVTPEDIKQIAPDILRHRIVISYEAEAEEITSEDIIQRILDRIEVPEFMLTTELIKKIRRIEIRTRRLVNSSFAGEYHAVFKGRGMEFDEVRPYQPGDEVRTIDWNVTARTGNLFVKRYIEERELTVMLLVDASASGQFGTINRFKREIAAELAAVLAFSAISNNDKVGLLIFTDQIELFIAPRKGRRHVLRVIRDLLAFEPTGRRTNLKLGLETLNHMLKRRSIIFLLSDFLTPPNGYSSILQVSNRRHDVIAVTLSDPRETTWPNVGLVALEDAETGQIQWVDTSNRQWRQAFSERVNELHLARERVFRKAKVDRINISTDSDYVIPLTRFFEQRTRRLRR